MTGLVLAGGGVKGSYQAGSYMAFRKCGIKIDGVVGTSIGSFNAAMIVSGKEKELCEFWENVDVGKLLNFKSDYINSVNNNEKFKELIFSLEEMSSIIKNKGIKLDNLKKTLEELIDEDKIRKSQMDFGLVTVSLSEMEPKYIFKNEMQKGKIPEYILASCNLPIFKSSKYIDNKIYIDGGFYDNNPVNMLLKKGYDKVYSIEIQGIGFKKKAIDKNKVIKITPSKFLGSTLNVNKKQIAENVKLGYYDTLKVLKNYDGYNFIFKKHNKLVYNILARRVDPNQTQKIKRYFNVKSTKEMIIKALEYVMLKEDYSYYNIYNILKVIREIKRSNKQNFVYEFVRKLRII